MDVVVNIAPYFSVEDAQTLLKEEMREELSCYDGLKCCGYQTYDDHVCCCTIPYDKRNECCSPFPCFLYPPSWAITLGFLITAAVFTGIAYPVNYDDNLHYYVTGFIPTFLYIGIAFWAMAGISAVAPFIIHPIRDYFRNYCIRNENKKLRAIMLPLENRLKIDIRLEEEAIISISKFIFSTKRKFLKKLDVGQALTLGTCQ
jgi:hypothetical protein